MSVPSTAAEREKVAQDLMRHHNERIASLGSRHRIVSSVIASVSSTQVTMTTVYSLGKDDGKDMPNVEGLGQNIPGIAGNPGLVTP